MDKRKVIKSKFFPVRYPILASALAWLWMDFYKVSELARGITYTLFAILWVLVIVLKIYEDDSIGF